MGNGQSIDDVFDVQGAFTESGTDDLSLNVLSARTLAENQPVTVFYYTASAKFRDVLASCQKYSRVLRHPKLVTVLSAELSGSNDRLTVVTEPVRPLSAVLESEAAAATLHSAEVAWQLHGLIESLVFLHSQGQVSHNNIGEQSVFVASDGSWKLGRLECTYQLSAGGGGGGGSGMEYLGKVSALVTAGRVPGDGGPPGPGNDLYGLSRLFEALKDRLSDLGSREVDDFREQLARLLEAFDSVSTSQPPISALLDHAIFRTEFQQIATFLSEITLQSEASKAAFFSSLLPRLRTLPPGLLARCLVKRLLTRFVVLDRTARRCVLPAVLTPRWAPHERALAEQLRPAARHCACHVCSVDGLLPVDEFGSSVLLIALKLFRVQDSQARLLVLEHFHAYCVLFDLAYLRRVVMPLVVRSLHDSDNAVVSSALRALADMVPMLGAEAVIGSPRQKLLYNGSPLVAAAATGVGTASEHDTSQSRGMEGSARSETYVRVTASHYDEGSVERRLPSAGVVRPPEHLLPDERLGHQSSARGKIHETVSSPDLGQVRPSHGEHMGSDAAFSAGTRISEGKRASKSSSLRLGTRMPQPSPPVSSAKGTAGKAAGSPQSDSGDRGLTLARPAAKGKALDVDALDIKSLTIKVKRHDEADIDFFADMVPAIALTSAGARLPPVEDGKGTAARPVMVASATSSVTSNHHSTGHGREQATAAIPRDAEVSGWGDAEAWPDDTW